MSDDSDFEEIGYSDLDDDASAASNEDVVMIEEEDFSSSQKSSSSTFVHLVRLNSLNIDEEEDDKNNDIPKEKNVVCAGELQGKHPIVVDPDDKEFCYNNDWVGKYLGYYECKKYIGTRHENKWHRVVISRETNDSNPSSLLKWKNDANCQWSLTPSKEDKKYFTVGKDCPYYTSAGHTICRILEEEKGAIVLLGPHKERYYRVSGNKKDKNGRKKEVIKLTDGNRKEIHPDGTFIVNGKTLGKGRWISSSRFIVQVKSWGNLWWVGEIIDNNDGSTMKSICVKEEHECINVIPDHVERYQ